MSECVFGRMDGWMTEWIDRWMHKQFDKVMKMGNGEINYFSEESMGE